MKPFVSVIILLTISVVIANLAYGTTWYITPDGTGDAPTIQAGIDSAAVGDTVLLVDGTFTGVGNRSVDFMGKAITVTSVNGRDVTIIDCEELDRGFLFENGEGPSSVLSGVTIQNGFSPWDTPLPGYSYPGCGGGIFCDLTSPTIADNKLYYNQAAEGGGIYLRGGSPIIENNIFENNFADTGCAIQTVDHTSLVLIHNTFLNNSGIDLGGSEGGAIECWGGHITFTDNQFIGNHAGIWGGAIACFVSSGVIAYNRFEGNAVSQEGGGIFCDIYGGDGPLIISNNEFYNNVSLGFGGGIYCYSAPSTLTIADNIFIGNSAGSGGGVYNWFGSPTITGNVFAGNSASMAGGGICSESGSPTIRNCTLSENDGPTTWQDLKGGAGIFLSYSDAVIENTIIAYSTQGSGIMCVTSSFPTITCSNIYGNAGGDTLCGIDGGGNFSADPLFCGVLGSGNYYVQSASPCAPANNTCGVLIGALGVRCDVDLLCPGDSIIQAFTDIPTLELQGFQITNSSAESLAFDYYLTAEGPATLVGDPLALSGTTPVLAAGQGYSPPNASLEIPEIREYAQETVTYHLSAAENPDIVDSCTTVVTFEPPVAVLISAFAARAIDSGVELVWNLAADEPFRGFKIDKRRDGVVTESFINNGGLLPPGERRYLDSGVRGGVDYHYTLTVVLNDGSEIRSRTVSVKTKVLTLALHQNHPNPFNPTTTISFTLPERVHAKLSIYDVKGRLVAILVDEVMSEGFKEVIWDGTDSRGNSVSSGVYFYRLKAGKKVLTRKMVLSK
jgi:hypothetical protein